MNCSMLRQRSPLLSEKAYACVCSCESLCVCDSLREFGELGWDSGGRCAPRSRWIRKPNLPEQRRFFCLERYVTQRLGVVCVSVARTDL